MSTVQNILRRCQMLGIRLSLSKTPGKLRWDGPADVATDDLLAEMAAHKGAILAELSRQVMLKPLDRKTIARMSLIQAGVKVDIAVKVMATAERHEKNWAFLVRDHGYPVGFFILNHVDNYLRLHCAKGISTEELPDGTLTSWTLIDAPATIDADKTEQVPPPPAKQTKAPTNSDTGNKLFLRRTHDQ